ncbi:angiopoietin-1 receptor-like [Acanthaster planci]|uniref:receptor protein-tyrosine kinase n=1 Tax=Acanthaster planci TaxID=133434 RepID=A0A8B7XRQ8_ACAPL|nr:angiopoietin-1 receptor-like [Acanthaster planci]
MVYLVRLRRNRCAQRGRQHAQSIDPAVEMTVVPYEDRITPVDVVPGVDQDFGLPAWAQKWGIPWNNLVVDERVLGRGNFGEVRSGAVKADGTWTKAAIKMIRGHTTCFKREDFIDEFWTMASIGYHPNIVLLLGACQHQDVLYVALEYLPHGDLRSYLQMARSQSDTDEDVLTWEQLAKIALDVARGMEHLAKAGVIHRDLAARNILIGEGMIAKVSDFGMSRGQDVYVQTSGKRVPLRWLAIESMIHQVYTTQSDVWSFGILLWEMATLGGTPYPSIRNEMLTEMLKKGYRLPKPDNCLDEMYTLMRDCWEEDPRNRPTFTDIVYVLTYRMVSQTQLKNVNVTGPRLGNYQGQIGQID